MKYIALYIYCALSLHLRVRGNTFSSAFIFREIFIVKIKQPLLFITIFHISSMCACYPCQDLQNTAEN